MNNVRRVFSPDQSRRNLNFKNIIEDDKRSVDFLDISRSLSATAIRPSTRAQKNKTHTNTGNFIDDYHVFYWYLEEDQSKKTNKAEWYIPNFYMTSTLPKPSIQVPKPYDVQRALLSTNLQDVRNKVLVSSLVQPNVSKSNLIFNIR